MKLVILLLLFGISFSLYGEGYFGINYSQIHKQNHKIGLNLAYITRSKLLCYETSIFYANWIKKDKYNNNKTNYSLTTIPHSIATTLYISKNIIDRGDIIPKGFSILLIPIILTNSNIELAPFKFNTNSGSNFSPFIFLKNNLDAFLFEKNNWIRFGSGLGFGLKFIARDNNDSSNLIISSCLGFQIMQDYLFKIKNVKKINGLFFSITISAQV